MLDNLIKIGKIISTHAIKGEVKFLLDGNLSLIKNINGIKIFLEDKSKNIDVYEVSKSYFINKKHILKLNGIDNINEAQKLINTFVYVNKDNDFIEFEQSYINFKAINNNIDYGIVIDEMYNGAQDLIKVRNNQNIEFWIPCVEVYIQEIDLVENVIYLKNIEGLI